MLYQIEYLAEHCGCKEQVKWCNKHEKQVSEENCQKCIQDTTVVSKMRKKVRFYNWWNKTYKGPVHALARVDGNNFESIKKVSSWSYYITLCGIPVCSQEWYEKTCGNIVSADNKVTCKRCLRKIEKEKKK